MQLKIHWYSVFCQANKNKNKTTENNIWTKEGLLHFLWEWKLFQLPRMEIKMEVYKKKNL